MARARHGGGVGRPRPRPRPRRATDVASATTARRKRRVKLAFTAATFGDKLGFECVFTLFFDAFAGRLGEGRERDRAREQHEGQQGGAKESPGDRE